MSEGQELIIREALPDDASTLLAYLHQVAKESDYLLVTPEDYAPETDIQAMVLADIYDSPNNVVLLALLGTELVGMLRLGAEKAPQVRHVAELGISVKKAYWNHQIGSALLSDGLDWAQETRILHKVTLDVQVRNLRAVHLYEKYGFIKEGRLEKAFFDPKAGYLDLWTMGKWLP